MGKVAAATETKKKKKKGRPSLADLQKRNLKQQQQQEESQSQLHQTLVTPSAPNFNSPSRRSTRRNSNLASQSPASESAAGDDSYEDDDDDDERKEKKVKLVVRLPPSNQHLPEPRSSANSQSLNSASNGSDTNADDENHEASVKKPKINAGGDRSDNPVAVDQLEKVQKATDTLQGSLLQSDPTTPLPDKKLLVFILDRLQKKDTYGVFSEPVDPNELPDYFEIVDTPMDFGTVRKKLEGRKYSTLDQFEADVFLICSNAMLYNAPDTVYYRQARSIQEIAKRDFANLRQVNDEGEPQPKIVRRGRPPTKNLKKPLGSSPLERVGPESSSDATLATAEENMTGSGSYNLRRPPVSLGNRSNDTFYRATYASRNNETNADWSSDWNSEFPASILRAEAKYGKKQFTVEENRRDTYKQFFPTGFGIGPSAMNSQNGEAKPLMGVGLQAEHGYARSLARFAANLGPVAWRIASKKIESALPPGVKFGPGWVGENEASSPWPPPAITEQRSSSQSGHGGHGGLNAIVENCSSPPIKDAVEAAIGQNSSSELSALKSGFSGTNPGFSFQTPQKQMLHPGKNGFNGVSGYDQMGALRSRLAMQAGQSGSGESPVTPQMLGVASRSNSSLVSPVAAANHMIPEQPRFSGNPTSSSSGNIPMEGTTTPEAKLAAVQQLQEMSSNHKQYSFPVPPDLNVRFQAPVSPSSSARVGSPQQPDLALQL